MLFRSLLQAPSFYSPYNNHRHLLDVRKNIVLERMKKLNFITSTQYQHAVNEKVTFLPRKNTAIMAPSFVFYILNKIESKYGTQSLRNGLKIITTLNVNVK